MCKAPKPPKPKEPKKPMFLRNRYLDEFVGDAQAVNSMRTGRSTLRIDAGSPVAIGSRLPGQSLVNGAKKSNNTQGPVTPVTPIRPERPLRPGEQYR